MVAWSLAAQGKAQAAQGSTAWVQQSRALMADPALLNTAQAWVMQNHASDKAPALLVPQLQAASIVARAKLTNGTDAAYQSLTSGMAGASRQVVDAVLGNGWTQTLVRNAVAQMGQTHTDAGDRTYVSGPAYLANLLGGRKGHAAVDPELAALTVDVAMPTLKHDIASPDSTGFAITQASIAGLYKSIETAAPTSAAEDGASLDAQLVDLMAARYADTRAMPVANGAAIVLGANGQPMSSPFLKDSAVNPDFFIALAQQLSGDAPAGQEGGHASSASPLGMLSRTLQLLHLKVPDGPPGKTPYHATPRALLDSAAPQQGSAAASQGLTLQAYMNALQADHDAVVKAAGKAGLPGNVDPWTVAALMVRENIGMPVDGQGGATAQYHVADESLLARASILLRARAVSAAHPEIDPNQATRDAIDQVRQSSAFASAALDAGAQPLLAPVPGTSESNPALARAAGKVADAHARLDRASHTGDAPGKAAATADYHAALIAELQAVYPQLAGGALLDDPTYTNWLRYAEWRVWADHPREPGVAEHMIAAEIVRTSLGEPDRPSRVAMLEAQLSALRSQPDADPHGAIAAAVDADGAVQQLLLDARNDVTRQAQTAASSRSDLSRVLQRTAQAFAPYAGEGPSGQLTQSVLDAPAIRQLLQMARNAAKGHLDEAASLMAAAQDSPTLATALYRQIAPLVLAELDGLHRPADYRAAAEIYQVLSVTEAGTGSTQDGRTTFLAEFEHALKIDPAGRVSLPPGMTQAQLEQAIGEAAPEGPQLFNDVLKGLPAVHGKAAIPALAPDSSLAKAISQAEDQPSPGSDGQSGQPDQPGDGDPTVQTLMTAQVNDGLQMQTFTSKVALTNYVGAAYDVTPLPDRTPDSVDAAYDDSTVVFGDTRLGAVVDSLIAACGNDGIGPGAPVTLRAMPVMVDGTLASRFIVQMAGGATCLVGPDGTVYRDATDWQQRGVSAASVQVTDEFGDAPVLDARNELAPLLVHYAPVAPKPSAASLILGGVGLLGMALSAFDGEITAPVFAGMEGAAAVDGGVLVEQSVAVTVQASETAEGVAAASGTTGDVVAAGASWSTRVQAARWTLGTFGRSIITAQGAYGVMHDAPALWRDPGSLGNWLSLAGDVASLGEGLSVIARFARAGGFGARAGAWGSGISRPALAARDAHGERVVNGLLPTLIRRGTTLQHLAFLASGAYGLYEQIAQWEHMPGTARWLDIAQDTEMFGLFALGAGRGALANARARAEARASAARVLPDGASPQPVPPSNPAGLTTSLWTPARPGRIDVPAELALPSGWWRTPSGLLVSTMHAPEPRGARSESGLWLPSSASSSSAAEPKEAFLAVYAHPDDETLKRDVYRQIFERGGRVDVVYFTLSNGGTMFELSDKGVPVPTRNAGTGEEETDPAAYGARRVQEMVDYWNALGGNASNLTITVLDNPDFNPFRSDPDNVDYGLKAGWNSTFNQAIVLDMLRTQHSRGVHYVAAFSTDADPRIHDAHVKASQELRAALDAYAAQSGNAPPLISVVEEGWYALRLLQPLDENHLDWPLADDAVARNNAALASVYHSQPPGHYQYFGNGRHRVLLRLPPDLTDGQRSALAPWLGAAPQAPAANDAAWMQTHLPDITAGGMLLDPFALPRAASAPPAVPRMIPVPKRVAPRDVVTTSFAEPATRPPFTGPETPEALHSQMVRARLASFGIGRPPTRITPGEEPQWFWLQTGAPYVKDPTLAERLKLCGRGNVFGEPARVATVFVTSFQPTDEAAVAGLDLAPGGARPWIDLGDARGEATRFFNQEFSTPPHPVVSPSDAARVPVIYRVSAPPARLASAIDAGHIPAEWVDGALMVVNARGALFHETWANRQARYAQRPGQAYTAPVRKGMTGGQIRRAAAKTVALMSTSAASAYLLRWGMTGESNLLSVDWPWFVNAGLGMFGYRALVNGTSAVVRDRLANRLAAWGAEPSGVALDTVAQQLHGWRATLRGIPRKDQDTYAMALQIVRKHADEPDPAALRLLDGASDKVLAPNSALAKALEALRMVSYGINDAAGARVWALWLHPDTHMLTVSFDTLRDAARSSANLATDLFVPVHWSVNGSEALQRQLDAKMRRSDLSYHAQTEGARARGDYRGNDHLPAFVQWMIGLGDRASVVHSGLLPDGSPMTKPPFVMRLKEYAMASAAMIGIGPFALGDGFGALNAFSSGHAGSGLMDLSMMAADALFAIGYRNSYIDLFRANRGMGPNVRQSFIPWLNAPLKGAQVHPSDITKRRLVDARHGVLNGFAPAVLVGVGMGARVVLGLTFPTSSTPGTPTHEHSYAESIAWSMPWPAGALAATHPANAPLGDPLWLPQGRRR